MALQANYAGTEGGGDVTDKDIFKFLLKDSKNKLEEEKENYEDGELEIAFCEIKIAVIDFQLTILRPWTWIFDKMLYCYFYLREIISGDTND